MNINKIKHLENLYDVCGGSKKEGLGFIYDASTPRGSCPLYKTLMSNQCSFDCKYCQNSGKTRNLNAYFEAEELAKTFIQLEKQHNLYGLFLSSAIVKEPDLATEKMLDTLNIIRLKYN